MLLAVPRRFTCSAESPGCKHSQDFGEGRVRCDFAKGFCLYSSDGESYIDYYTHPIYNQFSTIFGILQTISSIVVFILWYGNNSELIKCR